MLFRYLEKSNFVTRRGKCAKRDGVERKIKLGGYSVKMAVISKEDAIFVLLHHIIKLVFLIFRYIQFNNLCTLCLNKKVYFYKITFKKIAKTF